MTVRGGYDYKKTEKSKGSVDKLNEVELKSEVSELSKVRDNRFVRNSDVITGQDNFPAYNIDPDTLKRETDGSAKGK